MACSSIWGARKSARLAGTTALSTGASSGIGASSARRFPARDGASCVNAPGFPIDAAIRRPCHD